MTRNVLTTNYGDNLLRHTVRLTSDLCGAGTAAYKGLILLMQVLVDQPDLLRHGGACPETIKWYHDGTCWVVESTTITERPKES